MNGALVPPPQASICPKPQPRPGIWTQCDIVWYRKIWFPCQNLYNFYVFLQASYVYIVQPGYVNNNNNNNNNNNDNNNNNNEQQ